MKFKFITMDQPAGRFYIARISANVLIPISQSDTRDPYNSTGIQRKLSMERVRSIAKYCESETAMFPTPIILSGNSKYFKFYTDQNIEMEYTNIEAGLLSIDCEQIKYDKKFLSIVDGQHRLAGINESGLEERFDLLTMFVFDTSADQDAEIFSIINRNQKQVSKSLVYDLYGLTDEITVEKFSHEIVKALNDIDYSLLKGRIKMLGYKTDSFDESGKNLKQYVSQATIIDGILTMISKDVVEDNNTIKKGIAIKNPFDEKLILRKYFYSGSLGIVQLRFIGFYNAWIETIRKYFDDARIMYKTVGFIASLYIFKFLYKDVKDIENCPFIGNIIDETETYLLTEFADAYKKQYLRLMNQLNFNSINVNNISSSNSGAKMIYDILIENLE
ncbi:DGQHR domain-containing protein [Solobacterium sp.]|uniref:DGQHR domain-containing protein n=1 Tax=Solobacterium sp. TaxID=2060878 RepID=UPI001CAF1404|nr:DGQHR domain-containing protein [Solobacterium sp.]MBF1098725.1 DGQHR domain-containing protein [Solobacterium sp.]